jgi:hypothetical protein
VLNFIALVLSILVLAFSWNGIINTAEEKRLRRFWVLLGSGEILLAFICFAAIPELLYLSEIGNTALVIIFCVLSMGAILTACLYPNRE